MTRPSARAKASRGRPPKQVCRASQFIETVKEGARMFRVDLISIVVDDGEGKSAYRRYPKGKK